MENNKNKENIETIFTKPFQMLRVAYRYKKGENIAIVEIRKESDSTCRVIGKNGEEVFIDLKGVKMSYTDELGGVHVDMLDDVKFYFYNIIAPK